MKKTVVLGLLAILLVFGLIGCDNELTNDDNNTSIRYDGVYYRKMSGYTRYIRFYDDKTVITSSSTGTIAQIKEWFNKDREDVAKGIFTIIGNNISFSSTDEFGTVDYDGQILTGRLLLNSYSHINGNVTNNAEFKFSTW